MNIQVKKAEVHVKFEIKEDERSHINLNVYSEKEKIDIDSVTKILASGLALAIRGSENEGKLMREIMDYLNDEFINPDSFKDLKVQK